VSDLNRRVVAFADDAPGIRRERDAIGTSLDVEGKVVVFEDAIGVGVLEPGGVRLEKVAEVTRHFDQRGAMTLLLKLLPKLRSATSSGDPTSSDPTSRDPAFANEQFKRTNSTLTNGSVTRRCAALRPAKSQGK
jgi:hypothetical protein